MFDERGTTSSAAPKSLSMYRAMMQMQSMLGYPIVKADHQPIIPPSTPCPKRKLQEHKNNAPPALVNPRPSQSHHEDAAAAAAPPSLPPPRILCLQPTTTSPTLLVPSHLLVLVFLPAFNAEVLNMTGSTLLLHNGFIGVPSQANRSNLCFPLYASVRTRY